MLRAGINRAARQIMIVTRLTIMIWMAEISIGTEVKK
jgi:hypothetical protein